MTIVKRCSVCGRFRGYSEDDSFCVVCGHVALESQCVCGRGYDYALDENNQGSTLHCPRCGRALRGRSTEFDG